MPFLVRSPGRRQRRNRRAVLVVAFTSALALHARSSNASAASSLMCRGPEFVIEGASSARWIDAIGTLQARLERDADLDRCARLVLEPVGDQVTIRIVASDGRRAERRVLSPERLLETVEALVLLPPAAATDVQGRDGHELGDINQGAMAKPLVTERAQLELGGGATGRLTGAPFYGGAGFAAFAQLKLDHWLVGVAARWEMINDLLTTPSPSGFNMQTFSVGVGVGWRAPVGSVSVDAVAGPEIVVENQEAEGPEDGLGGSASDVRLDLLLRLSVPRAARTRFFAAADLDGSPSRLRHAKQLDKGLPSLPSWGGGLQLGIIWGAL